MTSFYYSFDTKQVVNPLDSITHFYVNPYMPDSTRLLNLQQKANDVTSLQVDWTASGIPVVVFPISVLDLKTVVVSVSSEDKIIIKKGNLKIYLKLTADPSLARIDSVLVH